MESNYEITNHDIRDFNQMNLDTFVLGLENSFESVVHPLIEKLKQDREELQSKDKDYEKQLKDSKLDEIEIERKLLTNGNQVGIYYLDQELKALLEMKIVYLYKFFEINIKRLIQDAFSIKSLKTLYRWEVIVSYLLGEGIETNQIIGYDEIVQLKDVNNSLKHSSYLDDNLKKRIPEFSNVQFIKYVELESFYNRIQELPIQFLNSLSSKIYALKYKFSDDKLNSIVSDLAIRMEKDDAEKLIQKLKKEYSLK
ncbi:hypothetical protein [Labilibaculum euxinus]